ncbi:MAG: hypothetical protein H7A33_06290 [Deltaproteobacteria bacterium]|nr:hypothetical protein [Deltaproteobacteria bacterium]
MAILNPEEHDHYLAFVRICYTCLCFNGQAVARRSDPKALEKLRPAKSYTRIAASDPLRGLIFFSQSQRGA